MPCAPGELAGAVVPAPKAKAAAKAKAGAPVAKAKAVAKAGAPPPAVAIAYPPALAGVMAGMYAGAIPPEGPARLSLVPPPDLRIERGLLERARNDFRADVVYMSDATTANRLLHNWPATVPRGTFGATLYQIMRNNLPSAVAGLEATRFPEASIGELARHLDTARNPQQALNLLDASGDRRLNQATDPPNWATRVFPTIVGRVFQNMADAGLPFNQHTKLGMAAAIGNAFRNSVPHDSRVP